MRVQSHSGTTQALSCDAADNSIQQEVRAEAAWSPLSIRHECGWGGRWSESADSDALRGYITYPNVIGLG